MPQNFCAQSAISIYGALLVTPYTKRKMLNLLSAIFSISPVLHGVLRGRFWGKRAHKIQKPTNVTCAQPKTWKMMTGIINLTRGRKTCSVKIDHKHSCVVWAFSGVLILVVDNSCNFSRRRNFCCTGQTGFSIGRVFRKIEPCNWPLSWTSWVVSWISSETLRRH